MKKTLIVTLALVFVLGLAGTAFANPYSDVPAGHWAYKAVTDLTKAGIVEGYQGKYRGQDNMTRYEMAAITARAMAKADKADAAQKATIDKLAVEFSKELNDLGVRVAKLEKSQSNIKWAGDTRVRWIDGDPAASAQNQSDFAQRVRLFFTANVNDQVSFTGKWSLTDTTTFGTYDKDVNHLYEAYVTHKDLLGNGSAVSVGRMSQKVGFMGYFLDSTGRFDGIQAVVPMGDVTVTGVFADMGKYATTVPNIANNVNGTDTNVSIIKVDAKASKDLALNAWYFKPAAVDLKIYGAGFSYDLAKDWKLITDWNQQKADDESVNNTHVRLQYKGVNAAVAGSWGAFVEYVKYEGVALESASNAGILDGEKGISIGYQAALMKNVTLDVFHSPDIKGVYTDKVNGVGDQYTRINLNFMF